MAPEARGPARRSDRAARLGYKALNRKGKRDHSA